MNLKLTRTETNENGVFGNLITEKEQFVAVTLEHAFEINGKLGPKIPPGMYQCKRGNHLLDNGQTIETFEIANVPGHTGILFHCGNSQKDSNGCVLLGRIIHDTMILDSRATFSSFMSLQLGVDEFTLIVEN